MAETDAPGDLQPPGARRAPRWMKIAFAISVGVNLLVAGTVIGHRMGNAGWRGHHAHDGQGGAGHGKGVFERLFAGHARLGRTQRMPPPGLRHDIGAIGTIMRALPRADRRAIVMELRQMHGSLQAARAELGAIRQRMVGVLQSAPFDRAAMDGLLDRERALTTAGRALLLDTLAQMSHEQRTALAARLAGRGFARSAGSGVTAPRPEP